MPKKVRSEALQRGGGARGLDSPGSLRLVIPKPSLPPLESAIPANVWALQIGSNTDPDTLPTPNPVVDPSPIHRPPLLFAWTWPPLENGFSACLTRLPLSCLAQSASTSLEPPGICLAEPGPAQQKEFDGVWSSFEDQNIKNYELSYKSPCAFF